jgi:hypothetical protein
MHKHKLKQTKYKSYKNQSEDQSQLINKSQLDDIACELDSLARQRLPDKVLRGDLTGLEAEIRQDAILLALRWFLKHQNDLQHRKIYPWNPIHAVAAALRISKREHLKEIRRDHDRRLSLPDYEGSVTVHPANFRQSDWSSTTILTLTQRAIWQAHLTRKITASNAAVALELLGGGISIADLAKRLGVHRSSIYQHLAKVKNQIPHIIDGMELPLIEGL